MLDMLSEMRQVFTYECKLRVSRVDETMKNCFKFRPPIECYQEIYQEIDSLYGAARAVDLTEWEKFCYAMSDLIAALRKNLPGVDSEQHDLLVRSIRIATELTAEKDFRLNPDGEVFNMVRQIHASIDAM